MPNMTVSEQMLRRIIKEEFREYKHQCMLGLTKEEAKEIAGHLAGVKSLGHGSITEGFSMALENHKYWIEQHEFNKSVANIAKKVAITIITGGLLYAMWEGVKHYVRNIP